MAEKKKRCTTAVILYINKLRDFSHLIPILKISLFMELLELPIWKPLATCVYWALTRGLSELRPAITENAHKILKTVWTKKWMELSQHFYIDYIWNDNV